ncbi:MAG TPA: hypothetical protein VHI78_05640 [Bacteroidales bacterium]|nr:hypothetical protein [Bacteroidales bacterium]
MPELYIAQKKMLTEKNSFFEHSKASLFIAEDEGKVVGRIAFVENLPHNNIYKEKTAFFGFFEVVERYEVAQLLFSRVFKLVKLHSYDKLVGPTNFTTNDTCGLLTSGFDIMPVILMPYNKKYYPDFLNRLGFEYEMGLSSYKIESTSLNSFLGKPVIQRIKNRVDKAGILIRSIRYKDIDNEILHLREIYNTSNLNNWGFIPLSENEFKNMAKDLKSLIPQSLILFAELNRKIIGFIVALPDYNHVFKRITRGRLFPFGLLKLIWYKHQIKSARILIMGILQEYRNKGVDIMLYKQINENLNQVGIFQAEACYVMENNKSMNSILEKIGGSIIKKYKIYKIQLG